MQTLLKLSHVWQMSELTSDVQCKHNKAYQRTKGKWPFIIDYKTI